MTDSDFGIADGESAKTRQRQIIRRHTIVLTGTHQFGGTKKSSDGCFIQRPQHRSGIGTWCSRTGCRGVDGPRPSTALDDAPIVVKLNPELSSHIPRGRAWPCSANKLGFEIPLFVGVSLGCGAEVVKIGELAVQPIDALVCFNISMQLEQDLDLIFEDVGIGLSSFAVIDESVRSTEMLVVSPEPSLRMARMKWRCRRPPAGFE
jgi:hypothetical protein